MSSARVRRRHGCAILLSIGQWEFGGAAPLDPPHPLFPPRCKLFTSFKRGPLTLHRQIAGVPAVCRTIKGMRKKNYSLICDTSPSVAGLCKWRN